MFIPSSREMHPTANGVLLLVRSDNFSAEIHQGLTSSEKNNQFNANSSRFRMS